MENSWNLYHFNSQDENNQATLSFEFGGLVSFVYKEFDEVIVEDSVIEDTVIQDSVIEDSVIEEIDVVDSIVTRTTVSSSRF